MVDGKKISVRYDHDSDEYIVQEPHAKRKIIRASATIGKHGMTVEQTRMMDNLNKPKPKPKPKVKITGINEAWFNRIVKAKRSDHG